MLKKRQQRTEKLDNNSILDQIERVIRWDNEFRLAFIKCNHPAQQEMLRRSLLERLSDQRILEIPLEKSIVSLLDEIGLPWNLNQPPVAVCVYGLENSLREQGEHSPVLGRLNHERDLLRQSIPAALLIWLPDFALDYVARGAPDFWAWRSGVYEFQTDSALWQMESIAAFSDHDAVSLDSLSWEDKQKEIVRLEELLRTSQALTRQDNQVKQTNCRLLSQLGFLYDSLGKQGEALDRYQQSLKLARAIGDRAEEGMTLNNLSQIYRARGDYETALRYLEESLAIQRAIGDRAGEGATLNNLSQIYQARGDYETAQRYLEESLAISRAIGDRAGLCATLFNMGHVYLQKDEHQQALACWVATYRIAKEVGYAEVLAALENLAKQLGGSGLEDWERLSQQMASGE
ncbi:MAG: tetratricopeptide repeat protein [Candidatus Competibacteraceae bacterium]|nr:tetratricopeptide repeat protein [Candidatus Competibacteraceae bacterium]